MYVLKAPPQKASCLAICKRPPPRSKTLNLVVSVSMINDDNDDDADADDGLSQKNHIDI